MRSKVGLFCGGLSLLALVISKGNLKGREPIALPFGHPVQSSTLTCEQVIKLADWGSQRFGGIGKKDVFHRDRASKIAQLFVEKLDPSRMLFTIHDLEEVKKVTQNHWSDLLQKHSCLPWQNWLEDNYARAQERISSWVKNYKASYELKLNLAENKKTNVGEKEISYTQFAANKKELESRWQKELGLLLRESSPLVFNAYHQNLNQFLWDRVEQKYFDIAPETHGLLAKAFLGGLDKYSTYFSPVEFEDFYEELKGTAAGLGLRLQKVPQGFMIEKVVESSAAQKSKVLHEGDIIEKVDNLKLSSLPFEEAKQLLKGPEHSTVNLTIHCDHKKGENDSVRLFDLTLERSQFDLEDEKINFAWKIQQEKGGRAKKVAVISVPTFYGRGGMGTTGDEKSVSEDFEKKIREELQKDTSYDGLVLDLRGNPGGYLEEAVSMGSLFLGDKPIVGVLEEGATRVLKAELVSQPMEPKPLVVLVDQESASAAEVLSGALKDYQRAVIVGSARTYGKGTVQKLFHLEDPLFFSNESGPLGTGVLKLTTSVFYSPLGHTPANGGVVADIALRDQEVSSQEVSSTQEIRPIVDSLTRYELEKNSVKHQELIRTLSEKSRERTSFQKDEATKNELDEAIAIVSDLSDLQIF